MNTQTEIKYKAIPNVRLELRHILWCAFPLFPQNYIIITPSEYQQLIYETATSNSDILEFKGEWYVIMSKTEAMPCYHLRKVRKVVAYYQVVESIAKGLYEAENSKMNLHYDDKLRESNMWKDLYRVKGAHGEVAVIGLKLVKNTNQKPHVRFNFIK